MNCPEVRKTETSVDYGISAELGLLIYIYYMGCVRRLLLPQPEGELQHSSLRYVRAPQHSQKALARLLARHVLGLFVDRPPLVQMFLS